MITSNANKDDEDIQPVDIADTSSEDTTPKRKKSGRPPLLPGEKGRYHLSTKTKAKNKIKRRMKTRTKKLKPVYNKIKDLNDKNRLDRKKIRAIDGGGVVSDKQVETNLLEDEQELVFRANPGLPKKKCYTAVLPVAEKVTVCLSIFCVTRIIRIIVPFFFVVR
jgi:hypothetical protein